MSDASGPSGPEWGSPPSGAPSGGYQAGPADRFGRPLAEWWKRLVAIIIDSLIVGVPVGLVAAALDLDRGFVAPGRTILGLVVGCVYFGFLNGGPRGQTVGKMVLNIQVRDADTGGPIEVGRGVVRHFVYQLLFWACFIPGLINGLSPLWDAHRQAWHDKAVRSVVIDVSGGGPRP